MDNMRKIKYRAWNRYGKCFVTHDNSFGGLADFFIELSHDPKNYILQQFTGLYNKDGKEIYEGDIVEWDGYNYEETPPEVRFNGKVVFVTDEQALYPETDNFVNGWYIVFNKEESGYRNLNQAIKYANGKVIGNIYQNPELKK